MTSGHDLHVLRRGVVCVRCFVFASDADSLASTCMDAVRHLPADAHREGADASAAACGADGGLLARHSRVSCGECIRLLREDAEKAEDRPHDLRLWDRAALCVTCGVFSSDPALLGVCAPIDRPGDSLFCLAVSSEGRGAESVCGKKRFAANVEQPFPQASSYVRPVSRRAAQEMLGSLLESRTHGRADCPDCLRSAAAALAPYRAAHDPRLLGDGVACADCGAFAARIEDMGECDRGYALEVAGKRSAEPRGENGRRRRTLLWIGMRGAAPRHVEGGCGRPPTLFVRHGALPPSPADGSASVRTGRITCRFCLRIARKAPGIPAAVA